MTVTFMTVYTCLWTSGFVCMHETIQIFNKLFCLHQNEITEGPEIYFKDVTQLSHTLTLSYLTLTPFCHNAISTQRNISV